jgi:type IV secretion system protein VirB10
MENEITEGEGPPEKDPNYRKKVQWFGLAAIGLLCFTLIISVFTGTGKRSKSNMPQPLPVDQVAQNSQEDSQRRLNEQIEQERLRMRREQEQKRIQPVEPEKRLSDIMEGKAAIQKQSEKGGQGGQLSIEQEFAQQERRRALTARVGRFGLRSINSNSADQSAQPAALAPLAAGKATDKKLEEEQRRVEKEIQRLQQMQQGAAPGAAAAQPIPISSGKGSLMQVSQEDPVSAITVGRPASEAQPKPGQKLIPTGTIVSAVLDQKLMSDYTGPFRALVSKDVYDVTGNHIVVPKGCRIVGSSVRIANINEPIQARMGLTVRWFVLPDGKRISLEKKVAALDKEGVPAIKDNVNYHFFAQFMGVAAYAVLASESSYEGSNITQEQSFEGNVSASLREQFAPLAAKYLNLVPTITLNIGTPMNVFLEDDIYANPWDSVHRKLYRAAN